ncbi:hypothetical protein EU774_21170, partial [Mycobacterium tuberculosis]
RSWRSRCTTRPRWPRSPPGSARPWVDWAASLGSELYAQSALRVICCRFGPCWRQLTARATAALAAPSSARPAPTATTPAR